MRKHTALFLGVLLWPTAMARADVPPDPVPKTATRIVEAPLVLAPGDKDDPQIYVRLPAKLRQRGHADARINQNATLIAGVALALSLSLAGLWLVRGGPRRRAAGAVVTLAVVLVAGISGCPPPGPDSRFEYYNEQLARPVREADGSLKGETLLQLEDERSSIQVVVPPEELAAFTRSQGEK
jgi:hypothetical protein